MKLPFFAPTVHIQFYPNIDAIAVFTERAVYETEEFLKFNVPFSKENEEKISALGEIGSNIIREVGQVVGVTNIRVVQKDILVVRRNKDEEWDSIIRQVLKIVSAHPVCIHEDGSFIEPEDWNVVTRYREEDSGSRQ